MKIRYKEQNSWKCFPHEQVYKIFSYELKCQDCFCRLLNTKQTDKKALTKPKAYIWDGTICYVFFADTSHSTQETKIDTISTRSFFYLCSLSQYSDENMMDPYNLAICFGPTLMPIPDGQDPVACQAHVNEVIKTIIIHHEVIFPSHRELDGPVYEKCMTGGEEYWWAPGLKLDFGVTQECHHSYSKASGGLNVMLIS